MPGCPRRRRAARLLATALLLAGAGAGAGPDGAAASPHPPRIEIFWVDGEPAGLLAHPAAGSPGAAVLVVHDALGLDPRADGYVDRLLGSGLAVLEIEPSGPHGPEGDAEATRAAAARVTRVALALSGYGTPAPRRVGALGFGAGSHAVLLAPPGPDGEDPFAARVLLYPDCAAVADRLDEGDEGIGGPVLLMHGDADPRGTAVACGELAAMLRRRAPVQLVTFPSAGRAWDVTAAGVVLLPTRLGMRAQGVAARVPAAPWPGLAGLSAARAGAFLAEALGPVPVGRPPGRERGGGP